MYGIHTSCVGIGKTLLDYAESAVAESGPVFGLDTATPGQSSDTRTPSYDLPAMLTGDRRHGVADHR